MITWIACWRSFKHLASLVHKPAPSSGLRKKRNKESDEGDWVSPFIAFLKAKTITIRYSMG